MSDFKDRLTKEKDELNEKIEKLRAFLDSNKFNVINDTQKALLTVQLQAMITYQECLYERIIRL